MITCNNYVSILFFILFLFLAADVFRLNRVNHEGKDLIVSSSFFEIYCGKVYDLLNNKKKLRILEDAKSKVQVMRIVIYYAVSILYLLSLSLCLFVFVSLSLSLSLFLSLSRY